MHWYFRSLYVVAVREGENIKCFLLFPLTGKSYIYAYANLIFIQIF